VGAVVAKGGKVLGEGFHRKAGQPHAEALALQKAGTKAKGADLYVTMEPCSTHGRTPPCTGAIRRAGIRRVIYGSSDADPRNAERSERILGQAGIRVVRGVLQRECDQLNEDYFHWTRTHRPWVVLKLAITLDGALAAPGRRWITGPEARGEVQKIRKGCDAILVGAETVRKDNPRLTVRIGPGRPQPWRAVVTKSGNLPGRAGIFTDAYRERTVVYRNRKWDDVLKDLHQKGVRRLLVEGGAKTALSLIAAGKVNEVTLFFAPETVERGQPRVTDWAGWRWERAAVFPAGRDLCLRGTLKEVN